MQIIKKEFGEGVTLTGYIHERIRKDKSYPRPAVLILPGGAYEHVSKREGEPVALEFLSRGYQAFILDYTVGRENIEKRNPEDEVRDALDYIRSISEDYDIMRDKIVLMGFSAGGHLALSSVCHNRDGRPVAIVLCYPVITTGEYGHEVSVYNITGGDADKKAYYSLENQIDSSLPPVFLWHTTEDKTVHPMNSIMLSSALLKASVPFEYHLFQSGKHGLSICTCDVGGRVERTDGWLDIMFSWLEKTLAWKQ